MQGLHLTADLTDCQCDLHWLTDGDGLLQACEAAVAQVGLSAVARLQHRFANTASGPGGVTATVLLAESHVCLHTWPESASVTLDVYVCNLGADHSAQARQLMAHLVSLFQPLRYAQQALWRGGAPITPP